MTMSTAAGRLCKIALALGLCLATGSALALPEKHNEARRRKAAERAKTARLETPASVGGVTWVGNRSLSKSELQAVAFTRPPDWRPWRTAPEFSEPTLIGDMSRIAALYRIHGFYQSKADYELAWNADKTIVAVTIHIDEGPQVRLVERTIELSHPGSLTRAERKSLHADLPLAAGAPFSANRYAEAKEILLSRLANLGHPTAKIRGGATVDVPSDEARVAWVVDPGPVIYLGEISIHGLYLVKEATARRENKLRQGDRYSTKALVATRLAMQRQGLFSWVSIKARPAEPPTATPDLEVVRSEAGAEAPAISGPDGQGASAKTAESASRSAIWPVRINVTERQPYTFDAGIGYSSDESFRAQVGWRNGNFLGNARKLRIQGVYSGVLSKAEIEFTQPYFFGTKTAFILRSSLRHEIEPAFTANRLLNSVGVSRPLMKKWRARVNYEHSYQDVKQTALGVKIILDEPLGRSKIGTLEFGLRRQTLDDLLNPTRGTWLDFIVAPTLSELGSDFDYMTYLIEGRVFIPTWFDGVLAGRIRIGAIQPIRGTSATQVPVVSRFYLGGSNSHRGFRYHELPPNKTFGNSVGGVSSLEASVEWRFPIWRKLGGVVFVDAGMLDLEPFNYPLNELFWAVGPGLRYDTIVGPLRFDFGVVLNPKKVLGAIDVPSTRYQWFISVGQSF